MVSSGVREVIRYLVEHRLVHVIVTSAGAVEEDIMKTLRPHYVGSFELPGPQLRMRGINRLGNLLVPNLNYVAFEDWFAPLLDELHDEQEKEGTTCTPSMLVDRMGRRVKDASSIWHWAHEHGIPVTNTPGVIADDVTCTASPSSAPASQTARSATCCTSICGSVQASCSTSRATCAASTTSPSRCVRAGRRGGEGWWCCAGAQRVTMCASLPPCRTLRRAPPRPPVPCPKAKKSGMVILGGSTPKHHTCNANLMRNGADFAVFINTGSEFDGSDSGARPDEAVSWGKIKASATAVKVYADATLVFPLLVAQSFAREVEARKAAAAAAAVLS